MRKFSPEFVLFRSLVFRDKLRGHSESISLLSLNAILALLSASSGFGIGHTENIISLHSSVHSTVTWDGITVLWSLIFRLFNTIEDFQGVFLTLAWFLILESLVVSNAEED
jgi:hypothetical protein